MGKIGIKNIAALLAAKKNISPEDAEKYVEAFFGLVHEALIPDKIVKIKGFGTFKLIDVRERESVDVNTGERMVIDGHTKVTFVPDTTLKELVNKPFSQFETVVLNDGVDFEKELESVSATENDTQTENAPVLDESQTSNTGVGVGLVDVAGDSVKEETADPSTYDESEKDAEETQCGEVGGSVSCAEEIPVPADMPVLGEAAGSTLSTDSPEEVVGVVLDIPRPVPAMTDEKAVETETPLVVEDEKMPADEVLPVEDDCTVEDDCSEDSEKRSSLFKYIYILVAAVVMALVFYGGYYFGANNDGAVGKAEPQRVLKPVRKTVVKRVKPVGVQTAKPVPSNTDTVSVAVENDKAVDKESSTVNEEKNKVASSSSAEDSGKPEMELAKRQVQTGAYEIDGLAERVKIKPGQTLEGISKFYLGEGMECYVKVYNNRAAFKEGDIVNIPKLRLKKKAANKKVS